LGTESESFEGEDGRALETIPPGASEGGLTSTSILAEGDEVDRVPELVVMITEVDCVEIAGVVLIAVCEDVGGAAEEEEEDGVTGGLVGALGEVSTPSASSLLFLFCAI